MHRCNSHCKNGFHYHSTLVQTADQQKAEYYGHLKKEVESHFAKDLPRPDNFERLDYAEYGPYLVLKLRYPNCTNFGGEKILVVKASLKDFVIAQHIDPHFAAKKATVKNALPSPEARFPPTEEGWRNACKFASILGNRLEGLEEDGDSQLL